MPRLYVAGDQVTTGSEIIFLHSSTFQLHVSDSLYSQALAFSWVHSGIALNNIKLITVINYVANNQLSIHVST